MLALYHPNIALEHIHVVPLQDKYLCPQINSHLPIHIQNKQLRILKLGN